MYRKQISVQDAVAAVLLMESSMHTSALLGVSSALHSVFPDNPHMEYKKQEVLLLKKLGLNHLINSDQLSQSQVNGSQQKPDVDSLMKSVHEEFGLNEEDEPLDVLPVKKVDEEDESGLVKKSSQKKQQPSQANVNADLEKTKQPVVQPRMDVDETKPKDNFDPMDEDDFPIMQQPNVNLFDEGLDLTPTPKSLDITPGTRDSKLFSNKLSFADEDDLPLDDEEVDYKPSAYSMETRKQNQRTKDGSARTQRPRRCSPRQSRRQLGYRHHGYCSKQLSACSSSKQGCFWSLCCNCR